MKPAPFAYARPGTVIDAARLLATHGESARILAGGQSLMPLMTRRLVRPAWVIDINRIAGLDAIEMDGACVRMGALVRQEQALRSPLVNQLVAGLAAALAWVANPVVRQRGTVVGNLVANTPAAELPAVALALDARFTLRYADREETVPADAVLGPGRRFPNDAVVSHVLWPRKAGPAGFYEVARRDGHAPVVSAMVAMSEGECFVAVSGVCMGGLASPTMARMIAERFPQLPPVEQLAGALRADLTEPVYGDLHSSARYRLRVAPVISQRAATSLAERAAA